MDVGFLFLYSNDKLNDPVHFTINSEGDEIAPARATPANAGRVTSARLQKDCCTDLTAGTLSRTLGDLFVTSSRFGLIQNGSARLDGPAFGELSSGVPNTRPETTHIMELLT